jgi:hypothetical protein
VVLFIGAGTSVLAGCPGWNEFADSALRWRIDHGKLSHSHLAQTLRGAAATSHPNGDESWHFKLPLCYRAAHPHLVVPNPAGG